MSTLQYDRKVSVVVGSEALFRASSATVSETDDGTTTTFGDVPEAREALELADFRVQFRIERGDTQTPNSANVRVFNLSAATARKITSSEFTRLSIQGGYAGNFGLLFDGEIKQQRIGRLDAKDSYVDITAADGDKAYNFSPLAATLAAGAQPESALEKFIAPMARHGIKRGYYPELKKNGGIRGRVYYGLTRDELRDWAQSQDLIWSIQDGKLTLIPKTSYAPGEIPVVSADSGLIGVPEQTSNGIHVRVLLNPSLRIGQIFRLDSTINQSPVPLGAGVAVSGVLEPARNVNKLNAEGLYYVMSADHVGDTRGEDFYTDLTCLAVDASVPREAVPKGAVQPEAGSIRRY